MNFLHIVFLTFSFAASFLQISFADGGECKNVDGSFCLDKRKNIVHDYVPKDQCMAQPGQSKMNHNALAFFLQKHQFCGGGPDGTDGLLICYRGQMDRQEEMLTSRGLLPTLQTQLQNVPGNVVTEKCEQFGPGMHGILLSTNDQGDWVFRLSTTNNKFVVKREEALEWLFFKLASAKDGGISFLSSSFGPKRDFMNWGKHQSGRAEEAKNRIRQEDDAKLLGEFFKNVGKGARMQGYAGLWSLGLDILPTDEDIHQIVLFVIRSECCADIQAWFNLPTGQPPIPNIKNVDQTEEIKMEGSLVENFGGILDGVVLQNAKKLIFELIDAFHPEGKAQGMRLTVNFEDNSIVFEHKLNDQWAVHKPDKPLKNHFSPGAAFHLVFKLVKNALIVNMNCYGEVTLPAGGDIVFENTHQIKISGGYKLVKNFTLFGDGVKFIVGKSWPIAKRQGVSAENSSGIMIEGKIEDDANGFSIKLWNRDEGDGLYNCILELSVGIANQRIKVFDGISGAEQQVKEDVPSYDSGESFEAFFQFYVNGTFDIWMNNTPILNKPFKNPKVLSVVHYVQIVGDATGNMVMIPKTPFKCVLEKSSTDGVNITAKVLPFFGEDDSRSFEIRLENTAAGGSTPLQLTASFTANDISTIELFEKIGGVEKASKKLDDNNLLKTGEYFDLKIGYHPSNPSEMVVNINGKDYVFGSKNKFAQTDEYEIKGDIIIRELSPAACKQK